MPANEAPIDRRYPNACCADKSNRRIVTQPAPDRRTETCTVCGSTHYILQADPGLLKGILSRLG